MVIKNKSTFHYEIHYEISCRAYVILYTFYRNYSYLVKFNVTRDGVISYFVCFCSIICYFKVNSILVLKILVKKLKL